MRPWARSQRPGQRWVSALAALLLAGATTLAAATEPATLVREIDQQFRRGETAAALQRLDAALAAQPGDAALRFLHGVLLAESGQTARASTVFERLTQEFPDLPEPHNNLAVLQAASGLLEAARASLETALQLDPQYRAAHENLGDVYVRLAWRAYARAADASRPDANLQRKLQLARDLARSLAGDGPATR